MRLGEVVVVGVEREEGNADLAELREKLSTIFHSGEGQAGPKTCGTCTVFWSIVLFRDMREIYQFYISILHQ